MGGDPKIAVIVKSTARGFGNGLLETYILFRSPSRVIDV